MERLDKQMDKKIRKATIEDAFNRIKDSVGETCERVSTGIV